MKKTALFMAMLGVMIASCQKPETVPAVSEDSVFTASVESFDSQTKTSMTSERMIVWSADDRLAIFQGSTLADEFKVTDASVGKANAAFTKVPTSDEVYNAGTELPCNVALYPYAEGLTLTGQTFEGEGTAYKVEGVVLPAEQTYAAGSFGNGAFPMVAVTESMPDKMLRFKNLLGAIKLQIKGSQVVSSITITGRNAERLSGTLEVMAYADNHSPLLSVIAKDESSKSVTLNCGTGVCLDQNIATDFVLSVPPMSFVGGFDVFVRDVDGNAYKIVAESANTVYRSSILVMPEVVLDDLYLVEDEQVAVTSIALGYASMQVMPGTRYAFYTQIAPADATDKSLEWSSSDSKIVSIDKFGVMTAHADGKATVTAIAKSGVEKSCQITVKSCAVPSRDYIDEYGNNLGRGIAVGDVVWAPVNCGYEPAKDDYKGYTLGKLYQWGRKYGQGYSTDYDASAAETCVGPVSPEIGQKKDNANKFYTEYMGDFNYDWMSPSDDTAWNAGTATKPKKSSYDPCPTGWRIPTRQELVSLNYNKSSWTTNDEGFYGFYFTGSYTYIDGAPSIFLPAAGGRRLSGGGVGYRTESGYYWSSTPDGTRAEYFRVENFKAEIMYQGKRVIGCSVRCVQE